MWFRDAETVKTLGLLLTITARQQLSLLGKTHVKYLKVRDDIIEAWLTGESNIPLIADLIQKITLKPKRKFYIVLKP